MISKPSSKRENSQRSELIRDNFAHIRQLKVKMRSLAADLGGALKWAVSQRETISARVEEKRLVIANLETEYKSQEEQHKERNKESNQEIGALRAKLREADKKQAEYEEGGNC